jgi:hypothetical protein
LKITFVLSKKIEINSEDYFITFRGEEMKKISTNLLASLVFLLISTAVFAQTGVGKLSGKVIDADTKEPLIGANIILLNTNLGAATDIEGNYFILNITPGTYEVKVSYVGYAPKTIQEVRLVANITYELNVELSTNFTLPEIVVQDKKFFEEKATNTVKVIDSEQISRLPVRGIQNIASLQSGVVKQEGSGGQEGNASINVRGGRGSEVLYIVDGVPQNNLYNRQTVAQVSNIAIDQISFQVGGYEAKYGQAQSGIVNVTTKTGQPFYSLFIDVASSDFPKLDDYGSNLYSGSLSGPIIPGIPEHTIFLSAERGWYADADPPAVPIEINTTTDGTLLDQPIVLKTIPNNPASIWRLQGKTNSRFGEFALQFSGLYNQRIAKNAKASGQVRYFKNDAAFIEEFEEDNTSFSGRLSQTVSNTTYWNLTLGYRMFDYQRYNPFFKDNLLAYGDSTLFANQFGVTLLANGQQTQFTTDPVGVYRPYGYALGLYQHREDDEMTGDFDLTSQLNNHLLEIGFGGSYHTVRGYGLYAYQLAGATGFNSEAERYAQFQPYVFGYDLTSKNKTSSDYNDPVAIQALIDVGSDPSMVEFLKPAKPLIAYGYLQDRFELEDIVLNLGLRMDYFDIKSWQLVNPALPYAGGSNPNFFDIGDFKKRDADVEFSPRIGIGFPVTQATSFHAQYGRFIQIPELNDMYSGPFDYDQFIQYEPQFGQNGALISEETTQYEVGLKQLLSSNSSLQITAFYKNTKSLVNVQNHQYQRVEGGEVLNAIYPENADFGTVKGFAFSFDVTRLSYFSASVQYTFSIAEGTGSSTNSSQTAVFRNTDRLPPKVIAPVNFDQRHTAVAVLDFFVPQGELGFFELFNVNAIISFNSGTPYTPVDTWNLLGDNGLSATNTGYINSAFGPSTFRIDFKLEKGFALGDIYITPYLWIDNLLNADNAVAVWRSTGSPYTTGYLNTPDGRAQAQKGDAFVKDYESLEKDPNNFGIPRLIKLGLKVNFSKFGM